VVPESASAIHIEYADHERVAARVIHRETLLDLAVIVPEPPRVDQTPVVFRERPVRPGEWVVAVGHPFGLGDTVTAGVVSGLGRDWVDIGKPTDLPQNGFYSFVQTDASINTGSSGGPIVDLRGEVLGIATAVRGEGSGIGFAVPAPMTRRYLEEVLTFGRFRRVRLGINAADDDEFPGRMATVKVTRVEAAGPGAKAGLQAGDYILAVAGLRVNRVSEVAYLTQLIGVDTAIELHVQRAGEPLRVVTLMPVEGK
jgi:S1-C subfamily serine protease